MSKVLGFALTCFSDAMNLTTGLKKTRFERVVASNEIETFRQMFLKREGILLPHDYLSRAMLFFCKNTSGRIVGGFAIVLQGPFRSLQQIPVAISMPQDLQLEEVNGLWLDKSTCMRRRMRFWTFAVGTVLRQKGNAIVYAVDSQKSALRESLFNHIRTWSLYEGVVLDLEGMPPNGQSMEAVEISSKKDLALQIMNYVGTYFTETAKTLLQPGKSPDFKFRPSRTRM